MGVEESRVVVVTPFSEIDSVRVERIEKQRRVIDSYEPVSQTVVVTELIEDCGEADVLAARFFVVTPRSRGGAVILLLPTSLPAYPLNLDRVPVNVNAFHGVGKPRSYRFASAAPAPLASPFDLERRSFFKLSKQHAAWPTDLKSPALPTPPPPPGP